MKINKINNIKNHLEQGVATPCSNNLNKLSYSLFIFSIIIFTSCDVDDLPLSVQPGFENVYINDFLLPYFWGNYNINLNANLYSDSTVSYWFNAQFYNNTFEFVEKAGDLKIDTFLIKDRDTVDFYNSLFTINLSDSMPVFGKYCHWGWTGKDTLGVPAWDTIFYSCKIINIYNFKNHDTLDLSKGLEIMWNPDVKNTEKIPILIHFGNNTWHTLVSDSGYFKVPDNIVDKFRNFNSLMIETGRESSKLFEIGKNHCSLSAITVCGKRVYVRK